MIKKIIVSGLLGGLVLIIWTFVVNGILGFRTSLDMKTIADERQVYELLKSNIVEPGRYTVNPELTPGGPFPDNEPVFSVIYGGMGHEAAGSLMLIGLIIFLIAPIIGAWLLSHASENVLSSYTCKVSFFTGIGILFALFSDLSSYGIGGYPLGDALLLAGHSIIVWTLVGLVVAWKMKPVESK